MSDVNRYFLLVTLGEGLALGWFAMTVLQALTGLSSHPSYAIGLLTASLFIGTIFEARYD